jgi:hypothetical protein
MASRDLVRAQPAEEASMTGRIVSAFEELYARVEEHVTETPQAQGLRDLDEVLASLARDVGGDAEDPRAALRGEIDLAAFDALRGSMQSYLDRSFETNALQLASFALGEVRRLAAAREKAADEAAAPLQLAPTAEGTVPADPTPEAEASTAAEPAPAEPAAAGPARVNGAAEAAAHAPETVGKEAAHDERTFLDAHARRIAELEAELARARAGMAA